MTLILRMEGVSLRKGYNLLIHELNFELSGGEILSLSGENGVGKTTLLRTLAGFGVPHAGGIVFEQDGAAVDPDEAPARLIHYLGHHDALSPSRTVAQELRFQAEYLGGSLSTLDRLNLAPLMELETRYLSAGQKRRLSLGRLLMAPRPVWLLDEPMAPLDAAHRALLADLMQEHAAAGGMVIAAVHDPLPFETRSLRLTRPAREVAFVE
jgi:heme exporter protein A